MSKWWGQGRLGDRQEKYLNSRRSRVAKTVTFWPCWQSFNSFSFEALSFFLCFLFLFLLCKSVYVCVCVCVCARARVCAYIRTCVRVWESVRGWKGGSWSSTKVSPFLTSQKIDAANKKVLIIRKLRSVLPCSSLLTLYKSLQDHT